MVSPNALSFAYQTGSGGSVLPQNVSVSTTGSPLFFTISASTAPPGGVWLLAMPPQGETPSLITVSVAPGLPPGIYSGQVTVTAAGAANSPVTIPVTLTVSGGPSAKLVFPVREDQVYCSGGICTPYTATISAIFDHYMQVAYEDPHCEKNGKLTYGTITDFMNESASGQQYHSPDGYGQQSQPE